MGSHTWRGHVPLCVCYANASESCTESHHAPNSAILWAINLCHIVQNPISRCPMRPRAGAAPFSAPSPVVVCCAAGWAAQAALGGR